LERQLTEALKRLSAQYEQEQRRQSGQVEALRRRVERQSAENEALRQHVERQSGENEALHRQVERLDGQVTRLAECYGTLAATL
ncbi:MAG: hypothetical protein OXO56_14725, partial [Gammaproteobacteria bacterium]|nr:hypothetical protein [Gammaproteobacteria bacterium]